MAGDAQVSDLELARQILVKYFKLLHAGQYYEAAHFYGGSYETLRDWNPGVPPNDYAALFQLACEQNGLVCLEIGNFISTKELSNGYQFTVEFRTEGGELLVVGSCCGADETDIPRQSHFIYTVIEAGDGFLVQELPVYVP